MPENCKYTSISSRALGKYIALDLQSLTHTSPKTDVAITSAGVMDFLLKSY